MFKSTQIHQTNAKQTILHYVNFIHQTCFNIQNSVNIKRKKKEIERVVFLI